MVPEDSPEIYRLAQFVRRHFVLRHGASPYLSALTLCPSNSRTATELFVPDGLDADDICCKPISYMCDA